ncbi:hypothetical protein EPO17_02400 [Patescibacteria group bacterium]|nr:MAG: hypothetical protein EPO17_02400 [Patescibacteria group bacterium]
MQTQSEQFRAWLIEHEIEGRFPALIGRSRYVLNLDADDFKTPPTAEEEAIAESVQPLRNMAVQNAAFMAIVLTVGSFITRSSWQKAISASSLNDYAGGGWGYFLSGLLVASGCAVLILSAIANEFCKVIEKKKGSWELLRSQLDSKMAQLYYPHSPTHRKLEEVTEQELIEKAETLLVSRAAGVVILEHLGKQREAVGERANFSLLHEAFYLTGLAEPRWDKYFQPARKAFQL